MSTINSKLAFKILPVLAFTALLAACNTTGGSEGYSANLSAQTFSHETSPSSNGYGNAQSRTAASQSN